MKKLSINLKHTFKNKDERYKAIRQLDTHLTNSLSIFENFLKKEMGLNLRFGVTCTVTLCGEYKIKSLNKTFRKKNKKTDVLSFPLFDFNDDFQPAVPIDLGDIFICFPVAKTQAKSLNVSLENELIHLFVHGFLHLLGFDHERSSKDERIMLKWEDHLIKKIHQKWK
jgi:probable rRNA maturation factor